MTRLFYYCPTRTKYTCCSYLCISGCAAERRSSRKVCDMGANINSIITKKPTTFQYWIDNSSFLRVQGNLFKHFFKGEVALLHSSHNLMSAKCKGKRGFQDADHQKWDTVHRFDSATLMPLAVHMGNCLLLVCATNRYIFVSEEKEKTGERAVTVIQISLVIPVIGPYLCLSTKNRQ